MVNAGRILIMSKGTWDSTIAYSQLDLVSYNSIAYLARQASVGVNPSTDVSMTYWQPFGSASQIATPTTPGLVMPDDTTIKILSDGTISVPIDGVTLKIDSTTGMMYADVITALSALSDVNVSSASNGQTLIYNSSTQKWENSNVSAASVAYSNTSSGMSATNVQAAIDEVEGRVDSLEAPTFTEAGSRTNVASGDEYPTLWGKVKKWFADLKGGAFLDTNVSGGLAKSNDLSSIYATGTTNTTGSAISANTYFYLNGTLVRAKTSIATNATFTLNTNYEVMSAGALNNLKNLITIGTATPVYDGSTSTYIKYNATLWTATNNGFLTASPVIANGYGTFYIGSVAINYYNSGGSELRISLSGFIKKGETFRIAYAGGNGVRADMGAWFRPVLI